MTFYTQIAKSNLILKKHAPPLGGEGSFPNVEQSILCDT